jgi:hypothetical protein
MVIFDKLIKTQKNKNNILGYHRAEVIGALASILLIWGLTVKINNYI